MKTKKTTISMSGHEMEKVRKALRKVDQDIFELCLQTWGDKPTNRTADIDLNKLFQPLVRTLEKYTDLVEVQR